MLNLERESAVYLAVGSTDMRKSIDGLAAIVRLTFKMDPMSPSMFVFCNRERNKLKILHWDHNGFWLYYRRLERGRFQWPGEGEQVSKLSMREFRWLLDGLSPVQHQAHRPVTARITI